MKKVLIALLTLTLAMTAVACGSDDADAANTTENTAATTAAPATTAAQTTAATTEEPEVDTPAPEIEFTVYPLAWADNNGDTTYYEITANDDGSTHVVYTMETYDDAFAHYGYGGFSWVNMAADVSEYYNGQTKFIMKVKGLAGDNLLIKPFDDQALEQTITFDGSEQVVEFDLTGVSDPASTYIILFGAGGVCDASGEFDIISAGFVE